MTYQFQELPKYVGGYRIGGPQGVQISLERKPIWLHRFLSRHMLGWEWVDAEWVDV